MHHYYWYNHSSVLNKGFSLDNFIKLSKPGKMGENKDFKHLISNYTTIFLIIESARTKMLSINSKN